MSTAEIHMRDEQLASLKAQMDALIADVESSKQADVRSKAVAEFERKLADFRIALDSFQIELKGKFDADDKATYKAKFRQHKKTYATLKNELEWKKTSSVKQALLGDHVDVEMAPTDESAEALMKHALSVQDMSNESLQRSAAKVAETQQIGRDAAVKLEAQTHQIESMYDDLDVIDSTLTRSVKVIKRMSRKVLCDKYLLVMIFLICAMLAYIVYKHSDGSAS